MRATLIFFLVCMIYSCTDSTSEKDQSISSKYASDDERLAALSMYNEMARLSDEYKELSEEYNDNCRIILSAYLSQNIIDSSKLIETIAMMPGVYNNQKEYITQIDSIKEVDEEIKLLQLHITSEENYLNVIIGFNKMLIAISDGKDFEEVRSIYEDVVPAAREYQEKVNRYRQAQEKYLTKYNIKIGPKLNAF